MHASEKGHSVLSMVLPSILQLQFTLFCVCCMHMYTTCALGQIGGATHSCPAMQGMMQALPTLPSSSEDVDRLCITPRCPVLVHMHESYSALARYKSFQSAS